MRAFVHSLGCRVNQYEAQFLAESLATLPGEGEIHVVNTCTVTTLADRKSRKLVAQLKRAHPGALVVAVGCGADGTGLRRAGADLVVGNKHKTRLAAILSAYLRGQSWEEGEWPKLTEEQVQGPFPRARALLKVQDGCTQACTFCRTWQVRGPLRSKPPKVARQEAQRLASAGHQEIVVTGINLAQYGLDLPDTPSLTDLLRELLQVPKIRIRLTSLNPEGVTSELIALFAREPRLCPYLHMPLQSGDDRVLSAMGRAYTAAEYKEKARAFLEQVPKATLGADVMVGFPGEDERAFARTVELLAELVPLNVHIFRYSPRPGTPAARLAGRVAAKEAAQRSATLAALAQKWAQETKTRFLGQVLELLVEEKEGRVWVGHTENYIMVGVAGVELPRGTIVPVRLCALEEDRVKGVVVDRSENCGDHPS
ncbi:MAG: MiaB/RimO family radical SAM methylthiotransferase [Candidatus Bipolaricaulota bacterium]|nr:MiaB/RimO family radical SAM methylthiotransferase [Candidatus Bipolaricaulota bacterium]MDW8126403.1 MiaB/RimO family radical SAM methylthiotransferase [Candidatus Bipolaricaulota bacterium]